MSNQIVPCIPPPHHLLLLFAALVQLKNEIIRQKSKFRLLALNLVDNG
jgi:hypothetical protein